MLMLKKQAKAILYFEKALGTTVTGLKKEECEGSALTGGCPSLLGKLTQPLLLLCQTSCLLLPDLLLVPRVECGTQEST